MAIELNVNRLNTAVASDLGEIALGAGWAKGKAVAALFGGSSVNVVSGATSDLEALIEKLRSETERAKFSVLLTSLSAIGQSLTDAQKRLLEQGLALSDKLDALDKTLQDYTTEIAQNKAAAAVMQAKIESL